MTQKQLQKIMKFHLKNFNQTSTPINNQTIHEDVLNDSDGYGASSSKRIYRATIRWTMKRNGLQDKAWPKNWFKLSVTELASKIL